MPLHLMGLLNVTRRGRPTLGDQLLRVAVLPILVCQGGAICLAHTLQHLLQRAVELILIQLVGARGGHRLLVLMLYGLRLSRSP